MTYEEVIFFSIMRKKKKKMRLSSTDRSNVFPEEVVTDDELFSERPKEARKVGQTPEDKLSLNIELARPPQLATNALNFTLLKNGV